MRRRIVTPLRLIAALAALVTAFATAPLDSQTRLTADDLFDDSRLHDLWIQVGGAEWQQLLAKFDQNTYYRTAVEWRGVRIADVGIRSRGGATRNDTKPGLQLDFDRYVPGQRFLGLESLVLDNLWHDPSMIKERVSMLLFRRMGLPAPREAHARVFLGKERRLGGLYAIVEDVDERFLTRNYREDGGYLYEYERIDGYHFENLGSQPQLYASRFEPKTREQETPEQQFGPLRDMVRVINDAPASKLESALAPYLDLDRFLMFVAIQNYLAVWDAFLGDLGMANFYVYRLAESTRFEFIPWDQDNTFTSLDFPPWYNMHKNALMKKVWGHAPLREKYLQQLMKVAQSADGWLANEVEREYQQIRAAALADTLKYHSNKDFEGVIVTIRRFARERSRGVRNFVARVRNDPNAQDLKN